ncbi:MAG: glycosyltransferase family 4 protein [Nanoarchaeota archaeon]|nr:glycosyltransferase family 4 protein [Nanoarchaeota archaeon]MBU0977068.1 glycosyltransferase family 4 protein [Nanoarchaeota archaeon]
MRIAFFPGSIYRYPASFNEPVVSGSLVAPFYLVRTLAKMGHDVHVFTKSMDGDREHSLLDGVKIHRFKPSKLRSLPRFFLNSHRGYRLFKKENERKRFDIIQTGEPLFFELFYAKRNGIRFVFSEQGSMLQSSKNTEIRKGWVYNIPTLLYNQPLFRWTVRKSDRLVFVVKKFLGESKEELGFDYPKERIEFIPNGIDIGFFKKVKLKNEKLTSLKKKFKFIAIHVGIISLIKGQDLSIRAFEKIVRAGESACLVIVGSDREKSYSEKIQRLVKEIGLEKNVKIFLNLPEKDLPEFYSAANISLVPSRGYDPMPNVIGESMACELPVISTDWNSRREILDNSCAFFIKEGDCEDLATKIEGAIKSKIKLRKMGEMARKKILEKDSKAIAKLYSQLYQRIN